MPIHLKLSNIFIYILLFDYRKLIDYNIYTAHTKRIYYRIINLSSYSTNFSRNSSFNFKCLEYTQYSFNNIVYYKVVI